jgi:hypothetical protein
LRKPAPPPAQRISACTLRTGAAVNPSAGGRGLDAFAKPVDLGVELLRGAPGRNGSPSPHGSSPATPKKLTLRWNTSFRSAVSSRTLRRPNFRICKTRKFVDVSRGPTPTPGVQHRSMHPPVGLWRHPKPHMPGSLLPPGGIGLSQSHSPNPDHDRLRTPGYAHLRTTSVYTVLRIPMTDAF